MSTPREALEAAIAADFDDRAAHMAYADYLQEQGDPRLAARGEFIQVQLALEERGKSREERQRLRERERVLLAANERAWLGDLAPLLFSRHRPDHPVTFRRGWIDQLHAGTLSVAFLEAARGCPLIRFTRALTILRSECTQTQLEELPDVPLLGGLRRFQFGEDYALSHRGGEAALPLVRRMPHLEELRLLASGVPLAALFALPLPQLRVLEVDHQDVTYPLEILAENPSLGNLTHLRCTPLYAFDEEDARITFEGVYALVHSPNLRSLTHLALHQSDLGDQGCEEIVASGILKRLKVLDLWSGRITDAGAQALADCLDLSCLEFLNIAQNALTEAGVTALLVTGVNAEVDPQRTGEQIANREHLHEGEME
jgi:uncharacterized protein (TIGR02996 family)